LGWAVEVIKLQVICRAIKKTTIEKLTNFFII
jgi:hypothetical protein